MANKTQTVQNGHRPSGPREVHWGREVVVTVSALAGLLLSIMGAITGGLLYEARQFAVAADDRATMNIKIARIDGNITAFTTDLDEFRKATTGTLNERQARISRLEHLAIQHGWKVDK